MRSGAIRIKDTTEARSKSRGFYGIMQFMRQMTFPTLEQISLTSVLYALSDPTRLQIVQSLAENQEMTCCAFVFKAPIAKSTLSHHFKVLRDAGVIFTRSEGTQGINSLRKLDLDQRFPGLINVILRVAG